MPVWLILFVSALYIGGLFWLAWRTDKTASEKGAAFKRPVLVYALALAVYCTSWTYFGAVGSAVQNGFYYLPIYLGPMLLFLFWPDLVKRISSITKRESITSLSDFLASRYGRSRELGALATVALTVGSLPYIALQLKSVGMSFEAAASGPAGSPTAATENSVLLAAIMLALFAILFGARHSDATRANHGLMVVLAVEAIIKILALGFVCLLSLGMLSSHKIAIANIPHTFSADVVTLDFAVTTFLALAAIVCLPRQFHVGIIEQQNSREFRTARWAFPLYLALTSLLVIPIVYAGLALLPAGSPPDLFVISLTELNGPSWLTLFVFLGGVSAATGMVIVAAVALSTMITNDLVVPVVLRFKLLNANDPAVGRQLMFVRRSVILALMLMSYLFYFAVRDSDTLMSVGLLSFSAAAQLFPALVGAVYWRRAHRDGAMAGIGAGTLVWAYTLILPEMWNASILQGTPFHPTNVLGTGGENSLTHGVFWSLGINTLFFIVFSLRAPERLRDRVQANVFSDTPEPTSPSRPSEMYQTGVTVGDLQALASRFLMPSAVENAFRTCAQEYDVDLSPSSQADWRLVQRTERLLSSALGSASARVVLGSAVSSSNVSLDDLLSILDARSHADRFDRHLLQSTLENISLGVSVVDGDQKLVAWNSAYAEMFELPDDLLRVGRPIADIIRLNAERGECGPGEVDAHVEKRLSHIRSGNPHTYERVRSNGMVLKTIGHPMPGGGYVTTFTDVTEDKVIERQLREAKENLEHRVAERTSELEQLTVELDAARRDAEGANASKTRFLAAASHDLLQPLNAARLYTGALQRMSGDDPEAVAEIADKVDKSIQSADQLLRGLLDISRLDHGVRPSNFANLSVAAMLADVVDEADPIACEAGLRLRAVPTQYHVRADADFLRSILRNFVSNAVRYTSSGGVLLGARRRGDKVRIEVWDTGEGVDPDKQSLIFDEFQRLSDADNFGVRGAGLGLSIARRMAKLMNADIGLRSTVGRGSVFFVELPIQKKKSSRRVEFNRTVQTTGDLPELRVLCIDDEVAILDGMRALLSGLGCQTITARNLEEATTAIESNHVDVVLVDYQLGGGVTGFDVLKQLEDVSEASFRSAMITADRSRAVRSRALTRGLTVLSKPVNPHDLELFLGRTAAAE